MEAVSRSRPRRSTIAPTRFRLCYEKGRIKMSASWKWQIGQTLELALNGGAPGGRATLWVVYRTPSEAPKAGGL